MLLLTVPLTFPLSPSHLHSFSSCLLSPVPYPKPKHPMYELTPAEPSHQPTPSCSFRARCPSQSRALPSTTSPKTGSTPTSTMVPARPLPPLLRLRNSAGPRLKSRLASVMPACRSSRGRSSRRVPRTLRSVLIARESSWTTDASPVSHACALDKGRFLPSHAPTLNAEHK